MEKNAISHTCDKSVSIKSFEFIKFTAIYNSGNDLQLNEKGKFVKDNNTPKSQDNVLCLSVLNKIF